MSLLLALDGSTTICGYTIWDKDTKKHILINALVFDETNTLIEKAEEFEAFLKDLLINFPEIDEMVIEESFTKFSYSDDKVIAMLNQINILYRFISYRLGLKTNTITVQDARKGAFPTAKFLSKKMAGGMGHKEQAFVLVLAELGEDIFPKRMLQKGPRKGEHIFEDHAYDMADSYIVGKGFINPRPVIVKKPKIKKFNKFKY